jgi:DNA-binding response OmpR family regulator
MPVIPYYELPDEWHVLIVDDNQFVLNLVSKMLSNPGMRLTTCLMGEEAYEVACKEHPHAILLDRRLIDTSGNTILQRLKNNPDTEDIPVAMISSDDNERHIVQSLAYGAVDYIVKPFSLSTLNTKVRSLLKNGNKDLDLFTYV